MKKRRLIALVMCTLMLLSILAGCGSKGAEESKSPSAEANTSTNTTSSSTKDHLYVVDSADVANLEPNESDEQTHYQYTRQIYETLFVYDENYDIQPWLCESYEYEDDCTIIMHIRQGVKFHNGDELKASDVMFTFKRIVDENLGGGRVDIANIDIDKCEVIDDYTFKFVTTVPSATQIPLLEGPATGILSERAYKEANGDFLNGACCGTGPYKFVSYAAGDCVELEAFEDYWREGEPYVKYVTIRAITDASSRAIEAETLGADIVYDINATDIAMVDAADGVSVISDLGTNTSHLLFNTAVAPMDDPLVREAIWYALDPEAAVKLAYGDFGSFATGWVCPGILGYDADSYQACTVTRDVEKAKALLAEAGYPDGLEVEIAVQGNNQQRKDMSEAFQAQMEEAGIHVTLNVMESATWVEYILSGKHMMTIYGFSCADFEADRALNQLVPSHSNYELCAYDNAEFQALVAEANSTMDKDAREKLYIEAAEMLMADHVTLPLWHKALNAAVSDSVEGFRITRSYEHHYLQYVKFK